MLFEKVNQLYSFSDDSLYVTKTIIFDTDVSRLIEHKCIEGYKQSRSLFLVLYFM